MILGVLLALAIVCSNLAVPKLNSSATEKAQTEQTSHDADYSFISAPTITPPASANIECSLLAHCIFEIDQQQQDEAVVLTDIGLHPRKLLITLFRVIIAPNAP